MCRDEVTSGLISKPFGGYVGTEGFGEWTLGDGLDGSF